MNETLNKYFPKINVRDSSRYTPMYKYKGNVFTYDKKFNSLINLFKDEEESLELGKVNAPWRELDNVNLKRENWDNVESRKKYLDMYCTNLNTEIEFDIDSFLKADYKEKEEKATNESVKIEEKYLQDKLNPVIWDENKKLIPSVKDKILELVEEFKTNLDFELKVIDIEIVGSNAAYNYTPQSDVDVHIITDFSDYGKPEEMVAAMMNAVKTNFNKSYDVDYNGYNVEIYVEDINSSPTSNGMYSVLNDRWIKEPQKFEEPEINLEPELTEYRKKCDNALKSNNYATIDELIDELYLMRRESLALNGEFGKGNLIFKQIRNDGLLDGLKNKKVEIKSKELSID